MEPNRLSLNLMWRASLRAMRIELLYTKLCMLSKRDVSYSCWKSGDWALINQVMRKINKIADYGLQMIDYV